MKLIPRILSIQGCYIFCTSLYNVLYPIQFNNFIKDKVYNSYNIKNKDTINNDYRFEFKRFKLYTEVKIKFVNY